MNRGDSDVILSAVFVDYDNIYLSLKRKNEEAAKRFAKDAGRWLKELQAGSLITDNDEFGTPARRRIVMSRCYGNPVPRRNQQDNSTDMNSFPFVRHHFLRAGFEIVDCPPLTAQLKNSSDIRMVMDIRDLLEHDTRFNEFIVLSSDADFTILLHRLRNHNRRTVIYANDNTAAPYSAIADAEVREPAFIDFLIERILESSGEPAQIGSGVQAADPKVSLSELRQLIVGEVVRLVKEAPQPQPLEALAEGAIRALGHDRTAGSDWGGAGSFLDLLKAELPEDIQLSSKPPYLAYDAVRLAQTRAKSALPQPQSVVPEPPQRAAPPPPAASEPEQRSQPANARQPQASQTQAGQHQAEAATLLQQSITRIHDASQAPPLAPPDYRAVFEEMAREILENQLQGVQTIANVVARCAERGVDVRREDIRFILDVVGEADPWFEQGASANLFAGRFRNFVVARCRSQGLSLSADELDLIEAWFASPAAAHRSEPKQLRATGTDGLRAETPMAATPPSLPPTVPQAAAQPAADRGSELGTRWWDVQVPTRGATEVQSQRKEPALSDDAFGHDDFPRIVRSRLKS